VQILVITYLTQLIRQCLNSAAGAAFSSRGRKAVDQTSNEVEARRAGTLCFGVRQYRTFGAQPFFFRLSTASRPWLFDDGPSDLNLATLRT